MWRNHGVQGAIKTAKRSYYDNKVDGLAETNRNKWWQDIKSLTGQDTLSKPVSKVCPPQDIKSDLRPIALTSCLAKVLEGFTNKRLLRQMSGTIDPRQYARHGHSTVYVLIYLMQAIHEAIDSGNYSVRIFFADFTKGFDVIDDSVLLDELKSFDIDQTLLFWIRSFLTNRVQAVHVGSSLSSWKQVNGGVPQGTKNSV